MRSSGRLTSRSSDILCSMEITNSKGNAQGQSFTRNDCKNEQCWAMVSKRFSVSLGLWSRSQGVSSSKASSWPPNLSTSLTMFPT